MGELAQGILTSSGSTLSSRFFARGASGALNRLLTQQGGGLTPSIIALLGSRFHTIPTSREARLRRINIPPVFILFFYSTAGRTTVLHIRIAIIALLGACYHTVSASINGCNCRISSIH